MFFLFSVYELFYVFVSSFPSMLFFLCALFFPTNKEEGDVPTKMAKGRPPNKKWGPTKKGRGRPPNQKEGIKKREVKTAQPERERGREGATPPPTPNQQGKGDFPGRVCVGGRRSVGGPSLC